MAQVFGADVRVTERRPVSGGDINRASRISLSSGETVFLKENRAELAPMFAAEAEGLRALAEAAAQSEAPPVPDVLGAGIDKGRAFLMLSYIPAARSAPGGLGADFGRSLAALHRESRSDSCGFHADNWIGSTPQRNGAVGGALEQRGGESNSAKSAGGLNSAGGSSAGWFEFFAEHRLGFQWALARRGGFGSPRTERALESLQKRLGELLPDVENGRASLLHGDLWGGNWLAGTDGRAWLIDPAVYYGHREADIAMTRLFGGFPPGFHAAYTEAWPLDKGFDERVDIYNLYHLLNHLNLFGSSYWGSVERILSRW